MPSTALIDAGPLIALFDASDKYHSAVVNLLRETKVRLITTSAAVTEASHMLSFSVDAQIALYTWLARGGVLLADARTDQLPRIVELTSKYRDRPMDFADATLIVAAETLGVSSIVSIDSDFRIYRLSNGVLLKNLLNAR